MIGKTNASGGGGASLNFFVVGGTSRPTALKENTIWVNTSDAITSWVFAPEVPASPTVGMLWFDTRNYSGTVKFNALKKNEIWVYPTACMQYLGGAWESKEAQAYQNGAWKDWKTYIIQNGDITELTGGWARSINPSEYGDANDILVDSNGVWIKSGGNLANVHASTKKAVDISNCTTLHFYVAERANFVCQYLTLRADFTTAYKNHTEIVNEAVAHVEISDVGWHSLDVSSLSSAYYVVPFTRGTNSTLRISEMYMM